MEIVLSKTAMGILRSVVRISALEDQAKYDHCLQVAYLCRVAAEKLRPKKANVLTVAGLLHDIGTFDIPEASVHQLNGQKNEVALDVRIHPQRSAAIVSSIAEFIPVAKIILKHHEHIDGTGYPCGLVKDQIEFESQILCAADKFCGTLAGTDNFDVAAAEKTLQGLVDKNFTKELFETMLDIFKTDRHCTILKDMAKLEEEVFDGITCNGDREFIDSHDLDRSLLHFFGRMLDAKNSYTEGHSRRVAYFSALIALALNLTDEQIRLVDKAAYLHDIGKLGIPIKILDKTGSLTADEIKIMRAHAEYSSSIIKDIPGLKEVVKIVGLDQEHFDGSGYPNGAKGEEIPIEARIISIADAFDAMTSQRSYHNPISVSKAIKEIQKSAGTQFDPEIAKVACKIFEGFRNSSVVASYTYIV